MVELIPKRHDNKRVGICPCFLRGDEWASSGIVAIEDFHVGHEERFGVLELRVQARHGGEKFEMIFPADREKAVSKTMEQVLIHAAP